MAKKFTDVEAPAEPIGGKAAADKMRYAATQTDVRGFVPKTKRLDEPPTRIFKSPAKLPERVKHPEGGYMGRSTNTPFKKEEPIENNITYNNAKMKNSYFDKPERYKPNNTDHKKWGK